MPASFLQNHTDRAFSPGPTVFGRQCSADTQAKSKTFGLNSNESYLYITTPFLPTHLLGHLESSRLQPTKYWTTESHLSLSSTVLCASGYTQTGFGENVLLFSPAVVRYSVAGFGPTSMEHMADRKHLADWITQPTRFQNIWMIRNESCNHHHYTSPVFTNPLVAGFSTN